MKQFNYTINGNKYEVAVGEKKDNKVEVTVNGVTYTVETESKTANAPAKVQTPSGAVVAPVAQTAAGANEPVKAPLPGVIREICFSVGDKVEAGQTVLVLEAMKMANNLEAEVSGTVTDIKVAIGDSVLADDVLIIIG